MAYELLFVDPNGIGDDASAGVALIDDILCDLGAEWPLKSKLAFTNMDGATLLSDVATLLPADKTVYEILEPMHFSAELIGRIQTLKQQGYRFAFKDFVIAAEFEAIQPLANYIKVDGNSIVRSESKGLLHKLKKNPSAKLIAENIDTPVAFRQCKEIGFDYFQGYYFTKPATASGSKPLNPTQATVVELMDKVRTGADIRKIEDLFKRDVALTFKLLRYINSAGFGLNVEVQSIRHAVSILGLQPLNRWLSLLLATASTNPTAPALTRTAISRGRFCELLGSYHMGREEQDNLFITGVFSLLDAMMEAPMESILDRVIIPEPVAEALLNRKGPYGPILALVEASETRDAAQMTKQAEQLILSSQQVNTAHLQALAWVEQLGIDS
ncbi:MAG: HDOD domain-containing protein [Hydrogenophilaceae bacterium]|nr:HDOD domain-containing protein [Hydrogenophilaceae bacterium]